MAGNAVDTGLNAQGGGDGSFSGGEGLPAFVPARFRSPLFRAATHWNVSAALLAAQLMAESNFNPYASSPAGAQGIAQFIPSTAAAYGLRDPFDPDEAIDAEAHLMSDLIHQFGSPQLALAAYNAGPAPVEACNCVPAIPETTAYVSRISPCSAAPAPLSRQASRCASSPEPVPLDCGSAGADPKAEGGWRAVAVAGGVDCEDAEGVSPGGSEVGAGRATETPGLAVELAVEAGSGLGGGESEGDPATGA